MKIESYKKKKSNIYEITFDNKDKISLFDDVILKYELLLKKEIDNKELENIINDNNKLESYYVALKYISTKLRTRKEIRNKLKGYPKLVVDSTIKRLEEEKYLNDDIYIKSYINDSINLKLVGPNKIQFELKNLGFDLNIINNYLNKIDEDIWIEKIEKYIKKKIDVNHNLSGIVLKQKIISDLISKGFFKETIDNIIDTYEFNDDDKIYEKEYNKIKNKLSKKYSGEELEYHLRMNLYKKGFTNKKIDY